MIIRVETEEDIEILKNIDESYRRGEITLEDLTHLRTLVVKREYVVVEEE